MNKARQLSLPGPESLGDDALQHPGRMRHVPPDEVVAEATLQDVGIFVEEAFLGSRTAQTVFEAEAKRTLLAGTANIAFRVSKARRFSSEVVDIEGELLKLFEGNMGTEFPQSSDEPLFALPLRFSGHYYLQRNRVREICSWKTAPLFYITVITKSQCLP